MSFEQIRTKFNLPNSHFFKFLQIRSFIIASGNRALTTPSLSGMEILISDHCYSKGRISLLYDMLVSSSSESSDDRLRAWKEDLHEDISLDDWGAICATTHSQTASTRLRLLQYNWLMRTYVTPVKLHQFNNDIPDVCVKCNSKGTLLHCMWECREIVLFWNEISQIIYKMLNVRLPLDPKFFILGLYPETLVVRKERKKQILLDMSLLQAKRTIALSWKNIQRPKASHWLREMSSCCAMERITYILKNKGEMYNEVWGPFILLLRDVDVSEMLRMDDNGNTS